MTPDDARQQPAVPPATAGDVPAASTPAAQRTQATQATQKVGVAAVPDSFWAYVKSFGPGIVVALTWVGTGDLIGSAVAGGTYGYALMWALALSLIVRFLFVSALARYPIYNIQQDTSIVRGFTRLHPRRSRC